MLAFKVRKPLDTCNERQLNLHCHINSWTSQIYDHYVSFASNILNSLQNWIANIDSRKMTLLIFEMKWVEDICVCSGLAINEAIHRNEDRHCQRAVLLTTYPSSWRTASNDKMIYFCIFCDQNLMLKILNPN